MESARRFVGLIVDGARMAVNLVTSGHHVLALWPTVVAGTLGVVMGTVNGTKID